MNWLTFFVSFAGGSFLASSIVPQYPLVGSLVIGLIIAVGFTINIENAQHDKDEKPKRAKTTSRRIMR